MSEPPLITLVHCGLVGHIGNLDVQDSFPCFPSPSKLESLVKSAKDTERRRRDDGYSWLKSKNFDKDSLLVNDAVADLKPMLDKLTPEGCSAIAVKLDSYSESAGAVTAAAILRAFKIYVEDEHELQMMKNSVKDMKFKNRGLRRNKVRPELLPPGREATVSFVLDADSHE